MATATFIQTYKMIDPNEEFLIDLDASIKENNFTIGTLSQIKKTVVENPNLISNVFFFVFIRSHDRTHLSIPWIYSLGG